MKTILERHAERLTDAERRGIRERVLRPGPEPGGRRVPWTLTAAAATLAAIALTLAIWNPMSGTRVPRSPAPAAPERARPNPAPPAQGEPLPHPTAGIVPSPRGTGSNTPSQPARPEAAPGITPPAAPIAGLTPSAPPAAGPATPGSRQSAPVPVFVNFGSITGRVTDPRNQPVAYANVRIVGQRLGSLTDENGVYRIERVPPAKYTLEVQALGLDKLTREGVSVPPGSTAVADARLQGGGLAKMTEQIAVTTPRRVTGTTWGSTKSLYRDSGGHDATGAPPPTHVRGGRSGEIRLGPGFSGYRDGAAAPSTPAPSYAPPPPVVPTTGGTRLPNDEPYDSMFFKTYGVNPFVPTDEDALSTFAVDVDAASYTIVRRYIELGHLPPPEAVRVEEFVNHFPQGYPRFADDDFRIFVDGAPSPFGAGYQLLRIGIKGREIDDRDRRPAQLTFVIDVSGSMAREDRLGLVKRALGLMVDRLRGDDEIGIVVFGTNGRVLLPPTRLGDRDEPVTEWRGRTDDFEPISSRRWRERRETILEAIARLRPEGSTNAEEGLRLGYEMARSAFRPGANNRIVLCSDGVANVGLTGASSILRQVRDDADRGIALTTIGFGMGNYNDVLLEQLGDAGDGNYYYVDRLAEARRVFAENLSGTLQTIARDAKVQVEFDSTRVLRYRLIGFENRDVADRDFRNDRVDAGEIGAGHAVTALYEVKLAPHVTRGTLATVRFRYARPERNLGAPTAVREIAERFDAARLSRRFESASPNFRLDATVAEFAEILRGSYWAKGSRLADVLPLAERAAFDVGTDAAAEFASLVARAKSLPSEDRSQPGATDR